MIFSKKVYETAAYRKKVGDAHICLSDYHYCFYFFGILVFNLKVQHVERSVMEQISGISRDRFIKIKYNNGVGT